LQVQVLHGAEFSLNDLRDKPRRSKSAGVLFLCLVF